jgi:hypothetical protein
MSGPSWVMPRRDPLLPGVVAAARCLSQDPALLEQIAQAAWKLQALADLDRKVGQHSLIPAARSQARGTLDALDRISGMEAEEVMALAIHHERLHGPTRASAFQQYNLDREAIERLRQAARAHLDFLNTVSVRKGGKRALPKLAVYTRDWRRQFAPEASTTDALALMQALAEQFGLAVGGDALRKALNKAEKSRSD